MSVAEIDTLTDDLRTLLDDARRSGEPIAIVDHGKVVARLIPEPGPTPDSDAALADQVRRAHDTAILDHMDQLAEEIGKDWPEGVSAVDAVREGRREL